MPGARWFAGATLSYPEHVLRGHDDDDVAIRHASELRAARRDDVGRAARADRAHPGRPARARRRPRRPRRRLHAEHPRDDRGVPRRRRGSARSGRAARRTSARARSSTASRRSSRRSCSRSTATATAGATTTAARSSTRSTRRSAGRSCASATSTARAGRTASSGRRTPSSSSSPVAVRPSPVGPVLERHDRPAEGDRPRPRRDPARAPQEAQPAPRRARRRPRLLVHDDRLDDVELPRRRAADAGLDRPLRRQPRGAVADAAVGARGRGADHVLRHERGVHRELHEGRACGPPRGAT